MPSDGTKLVATAAGAAVAGAVLAVAAMKLIDKKSKESDDQFAYKLDKDRPKRASAIYNELESTGHDAMSKKDSENLLFPHNHEEKMRRRIATRYTIEEENNTPRDLVTVRVPATSANVGPGCTFVPN
jgi:hypothetical protein